LDRRLPAHGQPGLCGLVIGLAKFVREIQINLAKVHLQNDKVIKPF
jgi:hypothetical protein